MKQMRDEYISVEHLFLVCLKKADGTVRPLLTSLDIQAGNFWKRCRPFAAARA